MTFKPSGQVQVILLIRRHTIVSDEWIGDHQDLPCIRRVCQGLRVCHHPGVEHHLSRHRGGSTKGEACQAYRRRRKLLCTKWSGTLYLFLFRNAGSTRSPAPGCTSSACSATAAGPLAVRSWVSHPSAHTPRSQRRPNLVRWKHSHKNGLAVDCSLTYCLFAWWFSFPCSASVYN